MAQPTSYDRQNSFTTLASVNPSEPYTGAQLDAEFNAVKVTLDEILANLVLIQADDGDLVNQSVGPDQLAASLSININAPSEWATATAYTTADSVFNGTTLYKCVEAHTSGTFSTDLAASKWEELADFATYVVADNTITTAKIVNLAVTTDKIAAVSVTSAKIATGAVEEAKIASGAVTTDKIADDAVTAAKMADDSVATASIVDANVTTAKLADAALTAVGALTPAADKIAYYTSSSAASLADLTSFARTLLDDSDADTAIATLGAEPLGRINALRTVTDSTTLVLADLGKVIEVNAGTTKDVGIPLNSSVAFPYSTKASYVNIVRLGAGSVTITAASGVTLNGVDGGVVTIYTQYGCVTLYKRGEDAWVAPNFEAA